MAIATFGVKTFDVSKNKIYTFDNIAYSLALNVENQEVEGKKPSTYIKGIGLIPLSFDILLDARFVDVKAEIDWWDNQLLSKEPEIFTLGGKLLSNNRFLLKTVSKSNIVIGKKGAYLKAMLALEFEEYASSGAKTTTKKKTSKKETVKTHAMSPDAIKAIEEAKKK